MDDAVFGSEGGLFYIRVPVLHSVTDYFGLGVRIHYIMTLVVVESRAYDVAIAAAEISRSEFVGLSVYEDTAACGTK